MRLRNGLALIVMVLAVSSFAPQTARADRVCHEECSGGVCRQVCIETEGRAQRREDRREERQERREERREDRRDREPGVELRVPGADVEVGR